MTIHLYNCYYFPFALYMFKFVKYSHRDVKIIPTDRIYLNMLFRSLCDPGTFLELFFKNA